MGSLFDHLQTAARRWPDRPAVIVQERSRAQSFTYQELFRLAGLIAERLRRERLRPGERCALLADNHAHWCAAYLGILEARAVAVPLDTTLKAEAISVLLRDSSSRFLFASPHYREAAQAAVALLPARPGIAFLGEPEPARSAPVLAARPGTSPAGWEDTAVILYTSGTTSDPKGVILTHGNLRAQLEAALQVVPLSEQDRILGVLPLFHALAQLANFLLPFAVGATVVFLEQVNTGEILRAFSAHRITLFCCVPQFFYLLHQRVLEETRRWGWTRRHLFRALLRSSGTLRDTLRINLGPYLFRPVHRSLGGRMRLLVTGGSRFDPAVGRDLHRLGFNLLQAYGLTECSGAATLTPPGANRIGSVGRPLPGVEVRVLPPEAGRAEAEDGEVVIRGPIIMRGYHERPDATRAALPDGWLRTGDLGYFDPEGHLYITGRKKEVIVLSSGKNIYPEEIESQYQRSPFLKEVCVLSRPGRPGEPLRERLHGLVVPDLEVLRQRKIVNVGEIVRFEMESLSLELPPHKRILSYEIWPTDLPRTTTRKLKRYEIERELEERQARTRGTGREARSWTREQESWREQPEVRRALSRIAQSASLPLAEIHPLDNLELDLGLDSMERVELLVALEQEFGRSVEPETASQLYTVRDLVEAIRTALADAPGSAGRPVQPVNPWEAVLAAADGADLSLAPLLQAKTFLATGLFLLLRAFYLGARVLLRLRVEGREHLPEQEPFLLCPNHESFLDVFLLVSALPFRVFRRLFFVGASEYFETPLRRWWARQIRVLPIDPDSNLIRAMQAGAFGLRNGKVLALFPEGERSIDGTLKPFKKGAAILSTHLQVPVVPVALEGPFEIWPRGRPPQRLGAVWLRFGPPLPPPLPLPAATSPAEAEEHYRQHTQSIRQRVAEMLAPSEPPALAGVSAAD